MEGKTPASYLSTGDTVHLPRTGSAGPTEKHQSATPVPYTFSLHASQQPSEVLSNISSSSQATPHSTPGSSASSSPAGSDKCLSLSSPELLHELKLSRSLRHVKQHSGLTTVFSGRGRMSPAHSCESADSAHISP